MAAPVIARVEMALVNPSAKPVGVMPAEVGIWRANARHDCVSCGGYGARGRYTTGRTVCMCDCVARRVFRACLAAYREIHEHPFVQRVQWERQMGGQPAESVRYYQRKREDYCADFYLVAKRALAADLWPVFRAYFLEGCDWKTGTKITKLSRGLFFHGVYRIEKTLGRTFLTLKPYALFPLDEYFYGTRRRG